MKIRIWILLVVVLVLSGCQKQENSKHEGVRLFFDKLSTLNDNFPDVNILSAYYADITYGPEKEAVFLFSCPNEDGDATRRDTPLPQVADSVSSTDSEQISRLVAARQRRENFLHPKIFSDPAVTKTNIAIITDYSFYMLDVSGGDPCYQLAQPEKPMEIVNRCTFNIPLYDTKEDQMYAHHLIFWEYIDANGVINATIKASSSAIEKKK